MATRPRWRFRWVKWSLLAATMIVWIACFVSLADRIEYRWGANYVGLVHFGINFGHYSSPAAQSDTPGLHIGPQTGKYFAAGGNRKGPGYSFHTIHLSSTFVILPLFTAAVFLPSLIRRIARTNRPGHCYNCDYDLTGNVTGACPECGARDFSSKPPVQ